MTLYIKTTTDDLELPEAVATSPQELADMTGRTKGTVMTMISKKRRGWHRIKVEEDE